MVSNPEVANKIAALRLFFKSANPFPSSFRNLSADMQITSDQMPRCAKISLGEASLSAFQ